MKYGLIGKNLKHSYSKLIHESLQNIVYDVLDIDENEVYELLQKRDFNFINVTSPYKEFVISYLDVISPLVKKTKSCNLIVSRKGKLYGYNTDGEAFLDMIKANNLSFENRKIAIMGTGPASRTIATIIEDNYRTKSINFLSRKSTKGTIVNYKEMRKLSFVNTIVNCTPIGMYPAMQDYGISPRIFNKANLAIDLSYNPRRTPFLVNFQKLGKNVRILNGLEMLINQAIYSQKIYFNREISLKNINNIYHNILSRQVNIVLIGLPGSGKTTIGRELGKKYSKDFIDLDELIESKEKTSVKNIILNKGIEYFRDLENKYLLTLAKEQGKIIALGGGTLVNRNINRLLCNSIFIYLKRDLGLINRDIDYSSHPTIINKDLESLLHERQDAYDAYKDFEVDNNGSIRRTIALIGDIIDESFNNKRA